MLVGTTFAWFTDNVTSGINKITAGNLDVELYHSDKAVKDEKVSEATVLFDDVSLWEPGAVAYENFVVKNEGNLALKYQMNMNFQNATNNGNGGTLADVLQVAVVEGGFNATNDREAAKTLNYDYNLSTFTLDGVLEAESESKTYGVVVYWKPSDIDNNYNMNNAHTEVLKIELGVNLFATQQMYESDSFGPDYDESVWDKAMKVMNAQELQAAIDAGEAAIMLSADIDVAESIVIPENTNIALNMNGHTITGTGLDADGNREHVLVNNGTLTVVGGTVTSTGTNGGSAIYNYGTLTLDKVTVVGAPTDTTTTSYASYAVNTVGTLTVNDSNISGRGAIGATDGAQVTVNGGTYKSPVPAWGHCIYANGAGTNVTISGGNFSEGFDSAPNDWTYMIYAGNGAKVTVNGGTFSAWDSAAPVDYYADDSSTIEISGGKFEANPSNQNGKNYVVNGYKAQLTGGTYHVVPENIDAVVSTNDELAAALQVGGKEIILTAGEFTADLYNIASRDSLVITGQGAATKLNFANQQVRLDLFDKLTISNCTIGRMVNKSWGQLVFSSSATPGGVYTISNCIFNGESTQGIFINQNVDATINIENCTFNDDFGREGAITIQDNNAVFTVNVKGCKFNNIPDTSNDIAVADNKNVESGNWTLNVDGEKAVATAVQLANAVANGATDITLACDIVDNVTIGQQPDVKITIDGAGHKLTNGLLVDGKSATYTTAGLTIKNVNFVADSITADACIQLGNGNDATRYTCNVTVENCTFDVPGAVGVKSYTGGDKNLTITGCTATANAHSLVQAAGIDGLKVSGCKIYSKNGINTNQSDNVVISGCTADVKGYAVRFGASSGTTGVAENYKIENCNLKSACEDGDAVIILRGTAEKATLTITNTTIEGTIEINNTATDATVVR